MGENKPNNNHQSIEEQIAEAEKIRDAQESLRKQEDADDQEAKQPSSAEGEATGGGHPKLCDVISAAQKIHDAQGNPSSTSSEDADEELVLDTPGSAPPKQNERENDTR